MKSRTFWALGRNSGAATNCGSGFGTSTIRQLPPGAPEERALADGSHVGRDLGDANGHRSFAEVTGEHSSRNRREPHWCQQNCTPAPLRGSAGDGPGTGRRVVRLWKVPESAQGQGRPDTAGLNDRYWSASRGFPETSSDRMRSVHAVPNLAKSLTVVARRGVSDAA